MSLSPPKCNRKILLCSALLVWFACLLVGFSWSGNYEWEAAEVSNQQTRIGDLGLEQSANGAVVMFVHPHCPCTRASIAELKRLLSRLRSKPSIHVAFMQPGGVPAEWRKGWLWKKVKAMPDWNSIVDRNGGLAKRCGARTSGEVLVFDASGHLTFRGGITASRGHEGGNYGANAVVACLLGGQPAERLYSVFGCPLFKE